MPIPKELIDAIAERVADIILDRLGSAEVRAHIAPDDDAGSGRPVGGEAVPVGDTASLQDSLATGG